MKRPTGSKHDFNQVVLGCGHMANVERGTAHAEQSEDKPTLTIVGCGYVGLHLAGVAKDQGWAVTATTRQAQKADMLEAAGITAAVVDPSDTQALSSVVRAADVVVHSVPPGRKSGDDRVTPALVDVLRSASDDWPSMGAAARRVQKSRKPVVVYLGATSVYPAHPPGLHVNEDSPVETGGRGQPRLDAENALRRLANDAGVSAAVLRLTAIYGPDRGLHQRIRQGLATFPGDGANMVNRIHVADIVRIVLSVAQHLQSAAPGQFEIFCLADDRPETFKAHADGVCDMLGLPRLAFDPGAEVPPTLQSNRIVDNDRFKQVLGLDLKYPSWREGLANGS